MSSLAAKGLVKSIDGYQRVTRNRVSPCRYVPSCSQYARDAVETHGAVRGSWLAMRRISRCHPFGGHGHDPVPEKRQAS